MLAFSFATAIAIISAQNCPNIANSVAFETVMTSVYGYNGTSNGSRPIPVKSTRIRFPSYISSIEVARLEKNGDAEPVMKLDSTSFDDPMMTTKYREYSGAVYYSTNFSYPEDNATEFYVVCVNANVFLNDKSTTCRVCKLMSINCGYPCTTVSSGIQSTVFNVASSRLEIPFYDLPSLNMNLECIVQGRNTTTSAPYDAYSYPSSVTAPLTCASEYYTIKSKIASNSVACIELKNVKPRFYYDITFKFEIIWNNNKGPFDWPSPLPIALETSSTKTFYTSSYCT